MIVVDTNIIIGVLRKHTQSIRLLRQWESQSAIGLSIVSYLEILAGVQPKEVKNVQKSLHDFTVLPFADHTIAELAAGYRQVQKIATPDAIIAATCEVGAHQLYTYDGGFKDLKKSWIHVLEYEV